MQNQQKQAKLAAVRQQALQKAARYKRLFETPDGQAVLEDLSREFEQRSSIVPGDPYQTHAREGAREVVLLIKQYIRSASQNVEGMDAELA